MSVINQLIIDFVKTGIKVPVPKEISSVIADAKKPAFMQNKNGNWVDDMKVMANAQKFDYLIKEKAQKERLEKNEFIKKQKKYELTNGTVDKLYEYLSKILSEIEMDFKSTEEECQFTKLLKDIPYVYNATYPKVIDKLKELLQMHNIICGKKYYDEKESSGFNDSTWRFDRFYSYCEEELLKICDDREKLLNYLIYAYYTDEEFYNNDKGILWNAFGEDICKRYTKGELCVSEKVKSDLKKKEKKASIKAAKIKEMCSNASIVKIKELSEDEIAIYDSEIKYISDKLNEDKEAIRLMIALLTLHKKINVEHKKGKPKSIKILKGKKNEVTINQICKLSDIYYNQIDNRLKILYEKGLIQIDISNMKVPKIVVTLPEDILKSENRFTVKNINDIKEYMKERKFA